MKILLLIGLIFSSIILLWRTYSWVRSSILWIKDENLKTPTLLKKLGLTKLTFIIGGVEHLIILTCLIVSIVLIYF